MHTTKRNGDHLAAATVSPEELAVQADYMARVAQYYEERGRAPLAFVRTYGCQQNVSDSQRMMGQLAVMGFGFTDTPENADFILFNTCAVREHAELRVFGNVGALKAIKTRRPHVLIALSGCMVQQPRVTERLQKSYPFVGLIFGTHVQHRLPELLFSALARRKQVVETPDGSGVIAEELPVYREDKVKAWLPIMYGCDNYCSYCIVPYVRGRERSRTPEAVLAEAEELAAAGYREITLLGQNVNSYDGGIGFPALLRRINAIPGDFLIRFMTSHPKDASAELFDTIAECEKVSRHIHLPFQSGSNRILRAMNRGYTREQYLARVEYARRVVPGIAFTSDVIVGFPGEERADFEQTLALLREVSFHSLFTFIYSPRAGTPAAEMPDPVAAGTKSAWFTEMTALQEAIAAKRLAAMVGKRCRVLLEARRGDIVEGRLPENTVVEIPAQDIPDDAIGRRAAVVVTAAKSWVMTGEILSIEE